MLLGSSCVISKSAIENSDNNFSPYFVVFNENDSLAQLPLQSTTVDVNISGVIADVTVRQVYTNTGAKPIEALYVFPASARAAVYAMQMKIGERTIIAQIQEKQKARDMYEQAKKEGKAASLLEEERPNVFKMNVANIMPGATVEVTMAYTELLVPTNKTYEFVYPTVVGPRYSSSKNYVHKQKPTDEWNANPYTKEGVKPATTLNISVNVNAGMPIQDIRCATHQHTLSYSSKTTANISLKEPDGGNRDFVAQYRLAGGAIETGFLTYKETSGENYFLAMVQPPQRVQPQLIPPREYIFIVDVSGSMNGFPLDISKELMKNLLGKLNQNDKFNIVFFAGGAQVYFESSLSVNAENVSNAIEFMDRRNGSGGTELLNALQTAMKMNEPKGYARSFIILTDGYVTVEKQTYDYIRDNLGNANFFSFGIGSSVNRYIIEGMAHVGYGEPFIAKNKDEASEKAKEFAEYIASPVLTDIQYEFNGFDAYDIQPASVPDLFADRPILLTGKFKGDVKGILQIKGRTGEGDYSQNIEIGESLENSQALKYLWAREVIRLKSDYASMDKDGWARVSNKDELKAEIIELGLKYNLLTEYTSFIAIDSEVSNPEQNIETIKQPLPLPKGVSNGAVGYAMKAPVVKELHIVEDAVEDEIYLFEEEEEVEEEEVVFTVVETMPEFPGGPVALRQYIADNIQYPAGVADISIEGKVFIEFIVDKDGNVTNVKVVRGFHPLLDAEAVRVVQSMPKWKPGEQRGRKVPVKYIVPVSFKL